MTQSSHSHCDVPYCTQSGVARLGAHWYCQYHLTTPPSQWRVDPAWREAYARQLRAGVAVAETAWRTRRD